MSARLERDVRWLKAYAVLSTAVLGIVCTTGLNGSRKNGQDVSAGAGLMFDQYKQDQTVGIQYSELNGKRSAGLTVWDRPDTPLDRFAEQLLAAKTDAEKQALVKELQAKGQAGATRVFVGKQRDRSAMVSLADPQGKPRLVLKVDEQGAATIQFLDAAGTVTRRFPE